MANRLATFCDGPCGQPESDSVQLQPYSVITPEGAISVVLCAEDAAPLEIVATAYAEHLQHGDFYVSRRRGAARMVENLDDLVP